MSNFIRGRHAPSLPAFHLPDATEGPHRGRPGPGYPSQALHTRCPRGAWTWVRSRGGFPVLGGPSARCHPAVRALAGGGGGGCGARTARGQGCLGVGWARNDRERSLGGKLGTPGPVPQAWRSWDPGGLLVLHPHLGRGQSCPHSPFSLRTTDGIWGWAGGSGGRRWCGRVWRCLAKDTEGGN